MTDLTEADSDQLRQIETRIKSIAMRMVFDIGEQLIAAKRLLGHGAFGRWIKSNVGMTVRNANRYMAATRRFGKLDIMSNLPTTVLLELSSESVPDAAVTQVLRFVEKGESVSVRRTKEIIQEYRQCPAATSDPESCSEGHSQRNFADEIFKRHARKLDRAGAERLIHLLQDCLDEHQLLPEQCAQSIIDRFGNGTDEVKRVITYLALGPPSDSSEAIPCTRDEVTQPELFEEEFPF